MSLNGTYNLTSDPNEFESVVFRMRDDFKYNFDKHDPLIEDFVLIHSPVKFLLLITGILILLKTTERFMSTREAFSFARPAFLVNCGLTFGINGIGALICIAVTEGGHHLFHCVDRSHLSLSTVFCRYLVFMYLSTLVYDLLSLVLPLLQKQKISNHLILRQLVWIGTAYVIMKQHPLGFPIFVPLTHSVLKVLNNMLTVMNTASKELKPEKFWSYRLALASIALHAVMLAHQVYFHTNSACIPKWVSSVITTGAALQTISIISSLKAPWRTQKDYLNEFILG